jgi:hypothetical protein
MEHGIVMEPTPWNMVRSRVRDTYRRFVGDSLNRLGVPGFIQPISYHDLVLGQHVTVQVTTHYTIVSIGGRDLFFNRRTGLFDGTGSSLCGEVCCEEAEA